MKVFYELDLDTFEAWQGAVNTLERVRYAGKTRELEEILDEIFPEGLEEVALNDLLWFDSDEVFEWLEMMTNDELYEAIDEEENYVQDLRNQLEELGDNFNIDIAEWRGVNPDEVWENDYEDEYIRLRDEYSWHYDRLCKLQLEAGY